MTLKQKTVEGLIWSGIGKWGEKLSSFLVFLVLVRLLRPEDFGLAALAATFIYLFQIFTEQGFSAAVIQRKNLEPGHLDTAFWTNMAFGFLMTCIVIAAAGPIASTLDQPDLRAILIALSPLCLFKGAYGTHQALLRKHLRFKALTLRSLLAQVSSGAIGITMAFSGFGVWSLVAQQFTFNLVTLIVLWMSSTWRPGVLISRRHFLELFPFSIHVFGTQLLLFLNTRSLPFLIGFFMGTTPLGYFVVAHKIIMTFTELFSAVIAQVSFPVFAKMQKDKDRLERAFYTATKHVSLLCFPIFIGLALLSNELIVLAFGEHWLPSAPLLTALAFSGIILSVSPFNANMLLAIGKSSLHMLITLGASISMITVFFLTHPFGILVLTVGYVAVRYIIFPIPIIALNRLIGLRFSTYYKQYIVPLIGSANMALAVLAFKGTYFENFNPITGVIIAVVLGTFFYGITVLLLDRKGVTAIIHAVSPILIKFKLRFS